MRPPSTPPEFREWTLGDGYRVRGRFWPGGGGRVGLLYLHGIQSHGGWYEWSASLLAARSGCPLVLPDRRGSGLNEAARGDTPCGRQWLDDLDTLADWMRRAHGVRQLGVVGVSWGGKLALAWALRRPEVVANLLLIAPGVFPAVDVSSVARFAIGASLLLYPRRRFAIPLDDPALFTDNPEGRRFIADDPRKLTRVTARLLMDSRGLDRLVIGESDDALRSRSTLVLAGRDRIIRNEPTEALLRRLSGDRCRVVRLANACHTIEFERDTRTVEAVVAGWAQEVAL